MCNDKRISYSKSFEHFHRPTPSSNGFRSIGLRYLKSASIRSYSNEDELKAFFVSFGYSFEKTKTLRRIYIKHETKPTISTTTSDESIKSNSFAIESESDQSFQLYCGHIPSDVSERELFEIVQSYGKIQEICLMMDAIRQKHRGFAFIKFFNEVDQHLVMEKMNNYKIRPGRQLKLKIYKANQSLYIANIPKSENANQLQHTFAKHFDGIQNIHIYRPYEMIGSNNSNNNNNNGIQDQNRGFCFVEFESHTLAWKAKRSIENEPRKFFKNICIFVDWADSMDTPTDEIMQNVRVLYVRNVGKSITESQLRELFERFGEIERIKRIKDFAFVHFNQRTDALNAMKELQNISLCGERLLISLSYPPLDKKKKEEILRMRQERVTREYSIRIRC